MAEYGTGQVRWRCKQLPLRSVLIRCRLCRRTTAYSQHRLSWGRPCCTRTSTTPARRTCSCSASRLCALPSEWRWSRSEKARPTTAARTATRIATNMTTCGARAFANVQRALPQRVVAGAAAGCHRRRRLRPAHRSQKIVVSCVVNTEAASGSAADGVGLRWRGRPQQERCVLGAMIECVCACCAVACRHFAACEGPKETIFQK